MKAGKLALGIVGILMLSIITFYSFNLIFTVVANHEALDIVTFSGLPLILFSIITMIALVVGYRYKLKQDMDIYYVRYYGIVIGIMSVVGLGLSIFTGAGIYHNFVGDYVFKCYPLIMTIVYSLMIIASIILVIYLTKMIKNENLQKVYKGKFLNGLKVAGLSIIAYYALERLGGFVLLPIYWSSYDGVYVIPYLIQLLIPTAIIVTYIIHNDLLHSSKVTMIVSWSLVGYSLFSLIYMILISKGNYPLTINPLSVVQQFERLVRYPISAIILYLVSFGFPIYFGIKNTISFVKEKKQDTIK